MPEAAEKSEATWKISEEVIAALAGIAAAKVEGVAGLSAGLVGDLSVALGRRSPARGVKVDVGEKEVVLDLYLVVRYGVRIPEVAYRVQEEVKGTVEEMTGLPVGQVNIHVQGVVFPPTGPKGGSKGEPG